MVICADESFREDLKELISYLAATGNETEYELLVLPDCQRRGVGSRLLELARAHTPTMLYFGAQPDAEQFYIKNGCKPGLKSFTIDKPRRD